MKFEYSGYKSENIEIKWKQIRYLINLNSAKYTVEMNSSPKMKMYPLAIQENI